MNLSYLCTNYPLSMRFILAILLITGLYLVIVILALLIENKERFLDAYSEAFKFIKNGKNIGE